MTIHLLRSPIGEHSLPFFSEAFKEIVRNTQYYFVENERTARRFISSLETGKPVQELVLFRLTKRTPMREIAGYFMEIPANSSVGVISEAGCPGIADPGALLVQYAHQQNYTVIPLPGPSSIFMALMGSGFSGQQFAFHGYLPQDKKARQQAIQQLESFSTRWKQTQIFMETPYRNAALWADLLTHCQPQTALCVAAGLDSSQQFLKTQTVAEWKKDAVPNLHKIPTIYLLSTI